MLVRWARAWWRYDGTRYVEHDDESLDRDLIKFLDVVVSPKKSGDAWCYERVTSKSKTIGEVRKAALHVFPLIGSGAPQWTSPAEDDPDPVHIAPCANGILDLRTRQLLPRTPRLFSTTAIGCAWDPLAEAPTWRAFLTSLWGDDTDSVRALQQMFGYFLTPDTSQQKLFALIGLPRSGKGTIARVLRALLGHDAVVNPTLDGLEETFGLQPLVGKTLAIIGDARLGGAKEQTRVVERLLSISGEDSLLINRKNTGMVNVRLRTRVLLLSNELPRLYDTSGALASRFVILEIRTSFLGREDTTLERKLLAELPGILRWAVDGYESLAEDGKFITPSTSEVAQQMMRALGSPMTVFLSDCCSQKLGDEVDIDALFQRYRDWCSINGIKDAGTKLWFGRNVHTLLPDVSVQQRVRPDGKRVRVYVGIGVE
jgi:putative DNA primase/helicase